MTKEEKLNILVDVENRIYDAIKTTDVKSREFGELMNHLSAVGWRAVELMEEAESRELISPIPAPKPAEPAPAPKTEQPETGYTFDEVKAKMVYFQTTHNLDVAKLMQSMGYQKLSAIPAERYNELLEKAQQAVDGEG